ncbi:hypothetical protein [Aliarcobacter cryaerophilus]|uniref:hypothetical protein n=1 Tax=Aliarcobacter cryaerophilus TaxID=28198 RepID=UPI0021B315E4|nr:hypothetical protein [Aliarcobacter cryaerophilus]MCT7515101.1 hypothetical protein [Aliarcobacter cryaerophilus]
MNIDLIHGKNMEDGYIHFPNRIDEKSKGCKISKAALRKLCGESEIELDFEKVFEEYKERILSIVNKKIQNFNYTVVEKEDIK